jgi:hypothetical protein
MCEKILLLVVCGLIAMVATAPAWAANPMMHEGMVVSAGAGKLTMKDKSGKEHSHVVGNDAKITVHGKPGRLEDLKLGMPIRVTTEGEKVLAVATIDDMK